MADYQDVGVHGVARDRGVRVPLAKCLRAGADIALSTGLGVDDTEDPDVRQLELARVGDVHGHDLVAKCQEPQFPLPPVAVEEVGDDDDLAAAFRGAQEPPARCSEIRSRARRRVVTRCVIDRRE